MRLVWRYVDGATHAQIAARQGTSDDAARKRVGRAIERVREYLARRGIRVGDVAAALAAINVNGPLPDALRAAMSASNHPPATGTAFTLATGARAMTVSNTTKVVVAVGVAALLGIGAATFWPWEPPTSAPPTAHSTRVAIVDPPGQTTFSDGTLATVAAVRRIGEDGSASEWWDPIDGTLTTVDWDEMLPRKEGVPRLELSSVPSFDRKVAALNAGGRRAIEVCVRIDRDSTRRSLNHRLRLAGDAGQAFTLVGDMKGSVFVLYAFAVDTDSAQLEMAVATGAIREYARIAPGDVEATRVDASGRDAPWHLASLGADDDGKLTVRMTGGRENDPQFADEAWQVNAFTPKAMAYFPNAVRRDGDDQILTFPIPFAETDHVNSRYRPHEWKSLGRVRLTPSSQPAAAPARAERVP